MIQRTTGRETLQIENKRFSRALTLVCVVTVINMKEKGIPEIPLVVLDSADLLIKKQVERGWLVVSLRWRPWGGLDTCVADSRSSRVNQAGALPASCGLLW